MLLIAVCFSLLAVVEAQLTCQKQTTSKYKYVNDIKVFGAASQSYHITINVEIDCEGPDSELSNKTNPANKYTAHFYNATVSDKDIKPENVANLCGKQQPEGGKCTIGDGSAADKTENERTKDMTKMFKFPIRFTQTDSGSIIRMEFMEGDFEHKDIMDMKKGIISSLQTKITEPGETTDRETDSTGPHTATFKATKSGNGLQVEKEYKVDSDRSSKAKVLKTAEVRVKSKTLIEDGEVADSSGELTSEMVKDNELEPDDIPAEDVVSEVKLDDVVRGSSKFNMKLTTKTKRSISRQKRMVVLKTLKFLPTSLEMDDLDDNTDQKYEKLQSLYEQLKSTTIPKIVKDFQDTGDKTKLSTIRSAIMLETELGFDQIQGKLIPKPEGPLVDKVVKASYGIFGECQTLWDKCRELLELCAQGGGIKTEEVFEFQLSTKSTLNSTYMVDVLNLASFFVNPSDLFILNLVHRLNKLPENSDMFGAMILTLGSLAGHKSVGEDTKEVVRAIILTELETISTDDCSENAAYADALEAIGNMGDIQFLGRLMEINTACGDSKIMRVALFHAMRNFLNDSSVQSLMIDTLTSFECDVSQDMVNLLSDEIQDQQLDVKLIDNWPSAGFNNFDNVLSKSLIDTPDKLPCISAEATRYFGLKLAPEARKIAVSLSERRKEQRNRELSKRGLVKHFSCNTWSSDNGRYNYIASDQTFRQDNELFNKRKHCLVHLGIGPDKANVQVFAGFFAGYQSPVTAAQIKLFAKAVARGKIFSKSFTIATILLYFERSTRENLAARVYIKIGTRVIMDVGITKPEYVNTQELYSSPPLTIPLGKIAFYIASLNIDVSLSGQVILTTRLAICDGSVNICLSFKPEAVASVTGSVYISLVVVRGGADITFSMNYYVLGEAKTRAPNSPCIAVKHGHDPATIALSFFYQTRFPIKVSWSWPPKVSFGWSWSDKKAFAPSSLSWNIGTGRETTVYTNCN